MQLRCPKCNGEIKRFEQTYQCENHHSYDIAKQGYTSLLLGNHKMTGDNKEMVKARTSFLEHGYYEPLRKRLCELIQSLHPSIVMDAGCGQGYYTNAIKKAIPKCDMVGFDLSKFALKQASSQARNNGIEISYVVASISSLPLADHLGDLLLSVFAPVFEKEFARVLKSHGYFIKVEPGPLHLYGLKEVLYEKIYKNEASACAYENFTLVHEEMVDYSMEIHGKEDIKALFQMTPYFYRSPQDTSKTLLELNSLKTQIQFHVEVYRKVE